MCYACDGSISSGIPRTWREFLLMPPEPQTFQEYEERFATNQEITGFGFLTTMHSPCPFCAAANYASWPVLQAEKAMQQERTCLECGRAGKIIFLVNTPDEKRFEFVQTAGPDAPSWLKPAPRRING